MALSEAKIITIDEDGTPSGLPKGIYTVHDFSNLEGFTIFPRWPTEKENDDYFSSRRIIKISRLDMEAMVRAGSASYDDSPPALTSRADIMEYEAGRTLTATDFYPDDTQVPMQDIPQSWKDEELDFGCWSGHSFKSKLQRMWVNMDYFEPEAKCPECGEWCYIKKWR